MPARDALWRDHQRTRWLKPDAHRWIKPDAQRFLKPGVALAAVFPAFEAKYNPNQPREPAGNPRGGQWTRGQGGGGGRFPSGGGGGFAFGGEGGFAFGDGGDIAFDLPDIDLGSLAFDDASGGGIASIFDGFDLSDGISPRDVEPPSFLDLLLGQDEGQVQLAQSNGGLLDKFGEPYYQRGGHHEMPRGVYEKWDLPPETRRVFDRATTGGLPNATIRTSPDGVPLGNYWNGRDGPHGQYNQAVTELADEYLRRNGLNPSEMTPDQAAGLLKEIRDAEDSRIRDFNNAMRALRRVFRLRFGRGE